MKPLKIIRIAALVVAIVAAFVTMYDATLVLVTLGLLMGFMGVEEERRMMYLVTAVALTTVSGTLGIVPYIGEYLTAILTNLSIAVNGGAVAVIVMIIMRNRNLS